MLSGFFSIYPDIMLENSNSPDQHRYWHNLAVSLLLSCGKYTCIYASFEMKEIQSNEILVW